MALSDDLKTNLIRIYGQPDVTRFTVKHLETAVQILSSGLELDLGFLSEDKQSLFMDYIEDLSEECL